MWHNKSIRKADTKNKLMTRYKISFASIGEAAHYQQQGGTL
jgi:hypothetical protein